MRNQIIHACAAIILTTSAAWAADDTVKPDAVAKIDQRMVHFKERIDTGKANKSITGDEATRLTTEYDAMARMIADAKADGKVTRAELKAIQERQAAFGKTIYADKHNADGKQLPDSKK